MGAGICTCERWIERNHRFSDRNITTTLLHTTHRKHYENNRSMTFRLPLRRYTSLRRAKEQPLHQTKNSSAMAASTSALASASASASVSVSASAPAPPAVSLCRFQDTHRALLYLPALLAVEPLLSAALQPLTPTASDARRLCAQLLQRLGDELDGVTLPVVAYELHQAKAAGTLRGENAEQR